MRASTSLGRWGRNRIHALARAGVVVGTVLVVGSGCQAITGSYSVPSQPGPLCTALANCCLMLPTAETAACLPVIEAEDESNCTTFLVSLGTACAGGSHDAGGLDFPDGAQDVAHDTGSTSTLTGTWTLMSATCEGVAATLSGTRTLTFSTGSAEEIENLSDGCTVTESISPLTISATALTSPSGTTACGASCTASDCTAGPTGAIDLPYTRSGETLTLSEGVPTTSCPSGVYLLNFSMN